MDPAKDDTLGDLVWPQQIYARSTNVQIDLRDQESVADYVFTVKSIKSVEDVLDGIRGYRKCRAWSLIGPYGSGKSTFILFLVRLLSGENSPWLDRCLAQLSSSSPDTAQALHREIIQSEVRFIPVVVQGSRMPLDMALCDALLKAATDENRDTSWVSDRFLSALALARQTLESGTSDSQLVTELYRQAVDLAKAAGYRGLVLAIDEFGKFLERARWQGDLPDLVAAQYLAEMASASGESGLLFVAALHQNFQHYASSLSRQQWLEWVKIQGRFQQIDFNEDPANLYGLVANSVHVRLEADSVRESIRSWVRRVWEQARTISAFQSDSRSGLSAELLARSYPFHPIALYALPRLSAYLGQNERTLFTFLSSDDPFGLKTFLRRKWQSGEELPSLTVEYLYDYFVAGARYSWLPQDAQRRVAEVDAALERLGDRPAFEVRLVKAIGVLGLLRAGPALPASEEVLEIALDMGRGSRGSLKEALDRLLSRKVIVYRRFVEEYRIWQGSDFDFDGAVAAAKEEIQTDLDLTALVNREIAPQPLLAHRHTFERGTTRLFGAEFVAGADLVSTTNEQLAEVVANSRLDGMVIYALPNTNDELRRVHQWASSVSEPRVLISIPKESLGLGYLLLDLAALKKVGTDWQELKDDPVAIKELSARVEATEDMIDQTLSTVTEPGRQGADWYWRGTRQAVNDKRTLNKLLSDVCDYVFDAAPTIRNELVNRQVFSSSVVVAVKKIISALLEARGEPGLGFSGSGPEVSIFRAVLEEKCLYGPTVQGQWGLRLSEEDMTRDIRPVWREIEHSLRAAENSPKLLDGILDTIQSPPYGLRSSFASFLLWLVLIANRQGVSLYEDRTYIRDWSAELFDRFVRRPSSFAVRWLMLSSYGGNLARKLNDSIPCASRLEELNGRIPLNEFLRNLYGWYRSLPDYARRTDRLPSTAKEFLSLLLTATDPIDMIFERIPKLLGLDSGEPSERSGRQRSDGDYLDLYANAFGEVLKTINEAYPELLTRIVSVLAARLDCPCTIGGLRSALNKVPREIVEYVNGLEARAFFSRAQQAYDSDLLWIESVGAAIVGQAPQHWTDRHIQEFENRVPAIVLALDDARKSYYASSRNYSSHRFPAKRLLVEKQGKLIIERYFFEEDSTREVAEASQALVEEIKLRYPSQSRRFKEMVLTDALDLMSSGGEDEQD